MIRAILITVSLILVSPAANADYHCSGVSDGEAYFTLLASKGNGRFVEAMYDETVEYIGTEVDGFDVLTAWQPFDSKEIWIATINKQTADAKWSYVVLDENTPDVNENGKCLSINENSQEEIERAVLKDLQDITQCVINRNSRCLMSYLYPPIAQMMQMSGSNHEMLIASYDAASSSLQAAGISVKLDKRKYSVTHIFAGHDYKVALADVSTPIAQHGESGLYTGQMMALSYDDGTTWYYYDAGSYSAYSLLEEKAAGMHDYLEMNDLLKPPSVTISGQEIPMRSGQWKQRLQSVRENIVNERTESY